MNMDTDTQPSGSAGEMRDLTMVLSERTPPPDYDGLGPADPDAQQIISEYSDFTEHLSADTHRSVNLIESLKRTALNSNANIERILKIYQNPSLIRSHKLEALNLRAESSVASIDKIRYQVQASVETIRIKENAQRHMARLEVIQSKLLNTRNNFPKDEELAQEQAESLAQSARNPKTTTRTDTQKPNKKDRSIGFRHHRVPLVYVPGEINPPGIDDSETDGDSPDSDSSSEDELQDLLAKKASRKSGNVKKIHKDRGESKPRTEKVPRPPRPPGSMGTNVHSTVAGISTSNALALLVPPPLGALPGSVHRPWLDLTDYELASLRKRMKKNAIWQPSATMRARELQADGRGLAELRKARALAETEGRKFEGVMGNTPAGAADSIVVSEKDLTAAVLATDEVPTSNRGMVLNKAKRAKREQQQREAAALAEGTSSAILSGLAGSMSNLFASATPKLKEDKAPRTPKSAARRPAQKRKRDSTADTETSRVDNDGVGPAAQNTKRLKTETPVPAPAPSLAGAAVTSTKSKPQNLTTGGTDSNIAAAPLGATVTTTVPVRASSPRKSSTPILPPVKERKAAKKDDNTASAIDTSLTLTPTVSANTRQQSIKLPTPSPPPQLTVSRRPASRGNGTANEPTTSIGKDRPRRASTVHNTPVPEAPPSRPASRRGRRAAPGPVGTGVEGSAAVKTKRDHAPRTKAGPKKQKEEGQEAEETANDLVDDGGEPIDPTEETYCVCHQVQYGVMVCCDNDECEIAWYHLPCVGLTATPKTTKWYCPTCKAAMEPRVKVGARVKK